MKIKTKLSTKILGAVFSILIGYLVVDLFLWLDRTNVASSVGKVKNSNGEEFGIFYYVIDTETLSGKGKLACVAVNSHSNGNAFGYDTDGFVWANFGISGNDNVYINCQNDNYRIMLKSRNGTSVSVNDNNFKTIHYPDIATEQLVVKMIDHMVEFEFDNNMALPKASFSFYSRKIRHLSENQLYQDDRFGDLKLFIDEFSRQLNEYENELLEMNE